MARRRTRLSRLATASATGAPHLIPIWGVWVDGHWHVEGGPTRWQRNLRENPQMAIHVEGAGSGVAGAEVVIVAQAPFDGPVTLRCRTGEHAITRELAGAISVA